MNFVDGEDDHDYGGDAAEMTLTATFHRQLPVRCVRKYFAMPNPANVNPVKTPMA